MAPPLSSYLTVVATPGTFISMSILYNNFNDHIDSAVPDLRNIKEALDVPIKFSECFVNLQFDQVKLEESKEIIGELLDEMLFVKALFKGWYIYFYCGVGLGVFSLLCLLLFILCNIRCSEESSIEEFKEFMWNGYFWFG